MNLFEIAALLYESDHEFVVGLSIYVLILILGFVLVLIIGDPGDR